MPLTAVLETGPTEEQREIFAKLGYVGLMWQLEVLAWDFARKWNLPLEAIDDIKTIVATIEIET